MADGTPGGAPGIDRVGPYTWEGFLERVRQFHSYPAPGVLVGGIMVAMAMEQIPRGVLFNAICETPSCLPDSVQMLTPCTVGNGWLRVVNLGRYAITLYNKFEGDGVRVHLDPGKLRGWDEIRAWYLKLRAKREQDSALLQEQVRLAGRSIYTLRPVQVKRGELVRGSKGSIAVCRSCGEAYPERDGPLCLGCQGQAPYETPAAGRD